MNARSRRKIPGIAVVASLAVLLTGCQAIFTYTPLTALQRSPASLPAAQRLEYAQNALASGDKTAMAAALLAIQDDPSSAAQYTAAQLGIEVSGVPQLLLAAVDGTVNFASGATSITDFLAQNPAVQPDYLIAAANRVAALSTTDPAALQPMDYVYGALGLALDAAKQPDGTFNFAAIVPTDPKPVAAQAFINAAIATLSPTDPTQAFLSAFGGFV